MSRSSLSFLPKSSSSICRTGSASDDSFFVHSSSTCVSRSSPSCRNSFLPSFFIDGHAASGSTSCITAATDRHRRIATRKSCTASASGVSRTFSSSFKVRSIQYVNPRCSAREPAIVLAVAIDFWFG
jgi:hypothetical protein